MERMAWRLRGRIEAYRHRADMLRRSGDLVRFQDLLLSAALVACMGALLFALARTLLSLP